VSQFWLAIRMSVNFGRDAEFLINVSAKCRYIKVVADASTPFLLVSGRFIEFIAFEDN